MNPPRRICLISPGHVSSNPRLVKEADALADAGFDVQAVVGCHFDPLIPADEAIFSRSKWNRKVIDYRGGAAATVAKSARRVLRASVGQAWRRNGLLWSGTAHHAAVPLLARAAGQIDAELFIGHCLAGLAAAALAARSRGARFAFDAEDFHPTETIEAHQDPLERELIEGILRDCLPGCRHVTSSSPQIGHAYGHCFGIPTPTTLLNVFPLSEAPIVPVKPSANGTRRFYWFSQTIGPGRGLESLLQVLAAMKTSVELHLRGFEAPGFRPVLESEARRVGFTGSMQFLPPDAPHQMARLAASYDLGLSLEQTTPSNRDFCLTNKIFTYLLAGIPMALSPTTAQIQLAGELGDAALMLNLADPVASARHLDELLSDGLRYERAREAAWRLGQSKYNWDLERTKLLALFIPPVAVP